MPLFYFLYNSDVRIKNTYYDKADSETSAASRQNL